MKHECKVCHAPLVTRDETNFYCKSCTWDIQQALTKRIEAALAEDRRLRLELARQRRDRFTTARTLPAQSGLF